MPALELLAPAKDLECGQAAIDCGADAVYVGGPRFGAREAAGNSMADIEKLAAYAHRVWARVYATVNTLLRDDELAEAERLCRRLHQAGVDALIIQDVGLLECDLPPLPLIASTQMHNHTAERVAFLETVGFSRAILARELDINQIRTIRAATGIELEVFIHGALCVSMSGQCSLSYALGGRSGNRGQCAQPCRRLYSLQDAAGATLVHDKHLLSLCDLNLTDHLRALIEAGVTSFKIEGRLKNKAYVMNVVGHYRQKLDALLAEVGGQRASSGKTTLGFVSDPDKTFNRGYTTYFLHGRGAPVASPDSPKHVGEPLGRVVSVRRDSFALEAVAPLHSGDGISFFGRDRELHGTVVNQIDGAAVFPEKLGGIERGLRVFRNHDHAFVNQVLRSKNQRRIAVHLRLAGSAAGFRLEATDEDGVSASHEIDCAQVWADKPVQARAVLERQLGKLGASEFRASGVDIDLLHMPHLPLAALNGLRRGLVEDLRRQRARLRPVRTVAHAPNHAYFSEQELSFLGNVLNQKAAAFYRRHGVERIEPAAESGLDMRGRKVMTARLCIKYEMGFCPREPGGRSGACPAEPWFLVDDEGRRLRLDFRCDRRDCVMEIVYVGQ
ncbi:MAG: U32 family peptidase [Polyangia bacterium]|jgi:putative protease